MRRRHFLGASLGLRCLPDGLAVGRPTIRSQSGEGIDVERIVSDTYDGPGLATGISESGDALLFGFDDGNVMLHGDGRDGEVVPHPVNQPVSHLLVREAAETAVVGWMDAGAFSLLNLAEIDGPYLEQPGLRDLATTPDVEVTTSVSYPLANPGTVRAVDEAGDRSWETPLDDAVGLAVAVTDDGDRVAVGAARYFEDGTDPTGQPGIRFYDGDGGELWAEEQPRAVRSVDVDADRELVVAATADGRAVGLDFDGAERWEMDDVTGWTALSADGSTVVSAEPDGLSAFESDTGAERWRVDVGFWAAGDISVSDDGDRVLAANREDAEFALVESGETIWTASHDVGPGLGALAADGETWSTVVTDTESGTSQVDAFRDETDASEH